MQKLKALLPTLKEHKYYLVYQLVTKSPFLQNPGKEITQHLNNTLGLFDAANAGILHMKWDAKQQKGTLNINRKFIHKSKVALSLLQRVGRKQVIAQTVGVSGILKKAQKRYVS